MIRLCVTLLLGILLAAPFPASGQVSTGAKVMTSPPAAPSRHAAPLAQPLFKLSQSDTSPILNVDVIALNELKTRTGLMAIELPMSPMRRALILHVERLHITSAQTQFVIGNEGGKDMPLSFDHDSIVLLRGAVAGDPQSRVFIAISERACNGYIETSSARYAVSSRSQDGVKLKPFELNVFPALVSGPVPHCEVHDHDHDHDHDFNNNPLNSPSLAGTNTTVPRLRQVQLAIDTDYQFFQVLGSASAAADYIVQLYGAVSDVFIRELNVKVDLTFVRIWNTPTVPFPSTLNGFRAYWNANMQHVTRDVAQMFSGRGDLPGGIAFVSALCSTNAYSFCGNAVGYFAGPEQSSVYNYDLLVAAHELGHNFGTLHTHDYDLDTCHLTSTVAQRGTLMSYCSQSVSGGNAVMDMAFHVVTRQAMREHTYFAPCVAFDCNQNSVDDALDISSGTSVDANSNGIPDECEDCNGNGILDPIDIGFGASADLNSNGLPDECEPDCNDNGVPDDRDIQLGVSIDLHGNGVPDECEVDCDSNGVSDYSQIMADMTLDKNRNVILDSCEDCDNDGVTDLVELDSAWNAWAISNSHGDIREYHAVTGVKMAQSTPGQVVNGYDLIVAPGRRVLVTNTNSHSIIEFDDNGNFVGSLVPPGVGGLAAPAGMLISHNGTLLVASQNNARVIEYNLNTGAYIRDFVATSSGGLTLPMALAYGPDHHLYVSSGSNRVFKYDGVTGAFISIFINTPNNGSLMSPRGMLFKPDGNLLVTSFGNNTVREFNGVTGAFIRIWSIIGVAFQGPWCIRLAPNGLVHVSANLVTDSHLTKADIHEFDIDTGNWVRGYVQGADAGLVSATGFDYLPGDVIDCNQNQVPDNCDIASGHSFDQNNNGIPDECEPPLCLADITNDGHVNVADLLSVISAWGPCPNQCPPSCAADIAPNCIVNVADLLAVITNWGACP